MLKELLLAMANGDVMIIKRVSDDQWEAVYEDDGFSRSSATFNDKLELEIE